MAEQNLRTGGCACAAVRYEIRGDPLRVSVCHCKQCQLRTGSAFGMGCYFPKEQVTLLSGSLRSFTRRGESGRSVEFHFCENCGSSVLWYPEVLPTVTAIAAGSFDDTGWVKPELHTWARSAQKWVEFPAGVEVLQESNIGKK